MDIQEKAQKRGTTSLQTAVSTASLIGAADLKNSEIMPRQAVLEYLSACPSKGVTLFQLEALAHLNPFKGKNLEKVSDQQMIQMIQKTLESDENKTLAAQLELLSQEAMRIERLNETREGMSRYMNSTDVMGRMTGSREPREGADVYTKMKENYLAIWEKAGRPSLETMENSGMITYVQARYFGKSEERACYNSITNAIYAPQKQYSELRAELAHAVYQQRKSQFWGIIGDHITHSFPDQLDTYHMVNTTEFNAHNCIEPVIDACCAGEIGKEQFDTEVDRRLEISQKLDDAGLEWLSRGFGTELISDISALLGKKGYFKDGAGMIIEPDEMLSQKLFPKESDFKTKWNIHSKTPIDIELLIHQVRSLRENKISVEEFWTGLKDMKETVKKIQGSKELSAMVSEKPLTASDISVLSCLKKADLRTVDEKLGAALHEGDSERMTELLTQKGMLRTPEKEVTPESLKFFYGMRRSSESTVAYLTEKRQSDVLASEMLADAQSEEKRQTAEKAPQEETQTAQVQTALKETQNLSPEISVGTGGLKQALAAMCAPEGVRTPRDLKADLTLSPAALKARDTARS